jgi:hypothetical protein
MDHKYSRYDPMNLSHILGFQNRISFIHWHTYFQKFKDTYGDDVLNHLVKFCMHVHKLRVKFHEDRLMNMFMVTLEGKETLGMKVCHMFSCTPLTIFI